MPDAKQKFHNTIEIFVLFLNKFYGIIIVFTKKQRIKNKPANPHRRRQLGINLQTNEKIYNSRILPYHCFCF